MPVSGLLAPVIALNGWTFVMEIWMYATRIPVIQKTPSMSENTLTKAQFDLKTPPSVRWKADNYNHLMEQPTQFYAIALAMAVAQAGKPDNKTDVALAWAYVGIRVLHSLIQSTSNRIKLRFAAFLLSSGVLAGLAGRAAMLVF